MFGSGDDKKSKQPADNADSLSTEEQQSEAVPEKSGKTGKKGLFSWFGRKKAEPKTEQADSSEAISAEYAEQSVAAEQSTLESTAAAVDVAVVAEKPAEDEDTAAEQPTVTEPQPERIEPVAKAEAVAKTAVESESESESLTDASETAASAPAAQTKPSRFSLFGGRAVAEPVVAEEPQPTLIPEPEPEPEPVAEEPPLAANLAGQSKPQESKVGWFARLKQGLAKTSSSLGEGMASLFLGKKEIDDDLLEELETRLLTADVGMEATTAIMDNLTRRVARKELADSGALYQALQGEMAELLREVEQPLVVSTERKPYVILVVGVNGAGKTTTIGKLASRLQKEGKKVMLAAGDTFRAAAVEQLQVWGERNKVPVIAQHTGADSASVIFDAVQAAQSRGMDVLIADTAGRLHTKDNLMEELRKVARVMGRLDESAPHEVLLVLDAGTGQNAINQTRHFHETIPVTGLALTKLDGTAKGGVIFALAKHFGIPVRYIGVGEGIDDLRDFVADDFVEALFAEKDSA